MRGKCIIVFIMILLIGTTFKAENKEVLDVKESVVRIITMDQYDEVVSTGTGFAVGKGNKGVRYFVTNRHVVEDAMDNELIDIYIVFEDLEKDSKYKAKVIYEDTYNHEDVAIIDIGKETKLRKPVTFLAKGNVQETDEIYAIGFPYVSDELDEKGYKLPSTPQDVTISKGTITKVSIKSDKGECYQVDATMNQGMSGGPLVTKEGKVIGINTFGVINAQAINGSIYTDTLFTAFKMLDIPYQKVNHINWFIISAVIIILVGLGIGVVVVNARRTEKEVVAVAQQAHLAINKRLFLIGVEGEYKDVEIPLDTDEPLVIGREPKACNIIFKEDTPGVSALHCEISYEKASRQILIRDLNSTYGTYKNPGEKLHAYAKVVLNVGEEIYLGIMHNRFKLIEKEGEV